MREYSRVEWDEGLERYCVWLSPNVCFTSKKLEIAEAYARGESTNQRATKVVPASKAPFGHTRGSREVQPVVAGALRQWVRRTSGNLSLLLREVASRSRPQTRATAGDLAIAHRKRVRAAIREGA